ncbi:hypothetical protein HNQ64_001510 [Prosthecobacter dejongeii]|uniref:Uncharacterized protein n=1 Tax=Prosthecobacter dejongeii TaxID=48465 RepID=A0A7W7YJC3_9BACT|nr:hypothetical protein [Prosthecobacter dejongeii]
MTRSYTSEWVLKKNVLLGLNEAYRILHECLTKSIPTRPLYLYME